MGVSRLRRRPRPLVSQDLALHQQERLLDGPVEQRRGREGGDEIDQPEGADRVGAVTARSHGERHEGIVHEIERVAQPRDHARARRERHGNAVQTHGCEGHEAAQGGDHGRLPHGVERADRADELMAGEPGEQDEQRQA
jgi:hypothetical protein